MFREIKAHSKRLEETTNQEPYAIIMQASPAVRAALEIFRPERNNNHLFLFGSECLHAGRKTSQAGLKLTARLLSLQVPPAEKQNEEPDRGAHALAAMCEKLPDEIHS